MRLAQQAAISHITPCGPLGCGLGQSEALLFQSIAVALAAQRRLAACPDPHYHRLARVMQDIPSSPLNNFPMQVNRSHMTFEFLQHTKQKICQL